MKDIIIGTMLLIVSGIGLYYIVKEERKMHDNYLENELKKIKMIIEEFKK